MTLAFQLAVFALITTSLILLISVPAVFASPDGWSNIVPIKGTQGPYSSPI